MLSARDGFVRVYRLGRAFGERGLSMISLRALARVGLALAVMVPLPALAQNAESETDRRVQDMVTGQKRQTDLRDKRCFLPAQPGDDIVVCADVDPERDRLPLRGELESARSTNDGLPRAPDLSPRYPGTVVATGCFIPPCPAPPVYYVDVKDLPEAPTGSDANLIATGEKAEP